MGVKQEGDSLMPAMDRDKIRDVLPEATGDIPWEYKVSVGVIGAPFRALARLSGHGEAVQKLSDSEEILMREYGALIDNGAEWNRLSAPEQQSIQQQLSDLLYRKSINP
jgi:hypothetical protein